MKLKRILSIACLGAMLVAVLAGCDGGINSYDPLPKEMDEKEILAAGQVVFDLLMEEDYETIVAMIREDIRNKEGAEINTEHIEKIVNDMANPDDVGTFESVKETHTRGSSDPEKHGIVVYECTYTEKMVAVCLAFDLKMNLIGLSIAQEQ